MGEHPLVLSIPYSLRDERDAATREGERIEARLAALEAMSTDGPEARGKIHEAAAECGRLYTIYCCDGTGRVAGWYLNALARVRVVAQRILGEREGTLMVPVPWERI